MAAAIENSTAFSRDSNELNSLNQSMAWKTFVTNAAGTSADILDIDLFGDNVGMPMFLTAGASRGDIATVLLAHGADVNAKNELDRTPLHWAAYRNDLEMAKLLLLNHADANAKDVPLHQTPLQVAEKSGHGEMAALLTPRESVSTGFFITDDGYLIADFRMLRGMAKIRVVIGTQILVPDVVKVDADNEIGLLKLNGDFRALPIVSSRNVALGATVAAVGFPDAGLHGYSPTPIKGEIATLNGSENNSRYFQISAPVQAGNGGGALVDGHGNVVGMISDQSLNTAKGGMLPDYAVKSSFLLSFLESVPEVSAKLKRSNSRQVKFEDVLKLTQAASVKVLGLGWATYFEVD